MRKIIIKVNPVGFCLYRQSRVLSTLGVLQLPGPPMETGLTGFGNVKWLPRWF